MAQEFGKRKHWVRLIKPLFLYVAVLAIPFSVFMVFVALGSGTLRALLFTLVSVAVVAFWSVRHLHSVYTYPLIMVDGSLMAVMEPMTNRKVYELERITHLHLFWHILLFMHNGWPVVVSLWELSLNERELLNKVLKEGRQNFNNGTHKNECNK